jgi:GNAT superfamily N-acetyltransferase
MSADLPLEAGAAGAAGAAIGLATAEDAEALAGLINAAYRVERHFVRGDRIDPEGVRQYLERGVFLVLRGDSGSALAACVYLEPRGETGYLGMLSVAPGLQGRGLGDRLLRAGESWLAHRGARAVEIRVVSLRRELFPWYETRGYRAAGTAPFSEPHRLLRPCCFVVMAKSVAS